MVNTSFVVLVTPPRILLSLIGISRLNLRVAKQCHMTAIMCQRNCSTAVPTEAFFIPVTQVCIKIVVSISRDILIQNFLAHMRQRFPYPYKKILVLAATDAFRFH